MISAKNTENKIVVVGLGYVGLPLAVAFSKKFEHVVGYDTNEEKVARLQNNDGPCDIVDADELAESGLRITSRQEDIRNADFYIVAVPTPIGPAHVPNLTPVVKASETVGSVMGRGAIVCYESTVYPGVTEEICGPILEKFSGLKQGQDFKLGYSPERINPGDTVNTLRTIIKIVSGEDEPTRERLRALYGTILEAGTYLAPSIKVAEAAKITENSQRDINIALVNELGMIFDRMGISTSDVLEAAGTKWNFMHVRPGLVGGHCIGVDPYYLTYRSEELGYIPKVIHAGREVNDGMGQFIAQKTLKLLCSSKNGCAAHARVGILGLTFKENVADLRNTKVADIVDELREYGLDIFVHDPLGDPAQALEEYGIALSAKEEMHNLDAVILAVAHDEYAEWGASEIVGLLKDTGGVFIDIKAMYKSEVAELQREDIVYWCL